MPERAKRDEALKIELKRVFDSNFGVYGARKVWWQLLRKDSMSPVVRWND